MNRVDKITRFGFYVMALFVLCCHILATDAVAGENSDGWRPVYDVVMMWLNFGILAFLLIKFGKAPILNFLKGRRDELSREIGQLEKEKQKVAAKIKETFKVLDDSEAHFADLKKKIAEQGEKKKEAIIEDARQQSQIMLEMAKKKIESHIIQAKNSFKSELIDAAIDLAAERLPGEITDEDNQKLFNTFLATDSLAD